MKEFDFIKYFSKYPNCPICDNKLNINVFSHEPDYNHFISMRYFGILFQDNLIGFDNYLNVSVYKDYPIKPKVQTLNFKIDINYEIEVSEIISKLEKVNKNLLFM